MNSAQVDFMSQTVGVLTSPPKKKSYAHVNFEIYGTPCTLQ